LSQDTHLSAYNDSVLSKQSHVIIRILSLPDSPQWIHDKSPH